MRPPVAVPIRRPAAALQGLVAAHAHTWLAAGNAVGLLLATLLLAPGLGDRLGPFGYGRWLSLHLDLLLYGWCSLPLVGLLYRAYLPRRGPTAAAELALGVWSGTLACGAVARLGGASSGKLFLEWTGPGRWMLVGTLGLLELVLVAGFVRRARRRPPARRARLVLEALLLAALAAVPAVFWIATDPAVYPAINPDSGGATGASLLGSSLGIVAVVCLAPLLMGLRATGAGSGRVVGGTWGLLALHCALFLALGHGDRSHHEPAQIAALASLVVWWPLLRRYLGRFLWPPGARRWLLALGLWGGALLATAVVTFLPGVLEAAKFGDLLVAHAHLAMAGMVSSFAALVLIGLAAAEGERAPVGATVPFALWHAGGLLMVLALAAAGWVEAARPGGLPLGAPPVRWLYALRWLAGAAMLAASLRWAQCAWARVLRPGAARATAAGEALPAARVAAFPVALRRGREAAPAGDPRGAA